MTGKEKCELLKSIRKNIADMNGIKYEPEECNHEGNCPGYCSQCDAEAAFLMAELRRKEAAGSPIRIDTESLGKFDTIVSEPVVVDDDEYATIGYVRPIISSRFQRINDDTADLAPYEYENIEGDIIDDEYDYKDEITTKPVSKEENIDGEQLLEDHKDEIESLCGDCIRHNTILATNKGVRCSCLSEYFFMNMVEKQICSLKKTQDK